MMTAREAHIAIKNISNRQRANFLFQAKIHGAEIKGGDTDETRIEFDKEKAEKFDEAIEKLNKQRFGDGT